MRGSDSSTPLLNTVTRCPSDASTAAVALQSSSLPPQLRFPLTKTTFTRLFSLDRGPYRPHPCGPLVGLQDRSDPVDVLCDRAGPRRRPGLALGERVAAADRDRAGRDLRQSAERHYGSRRRPQGGETQWRGWPPALDDRDARRDHSRGGSPIRLALAR